MNIYNMYCDESCHLENDGQNSIVLGTIWTPIDSVKKAFLDIKNIKIKNHMSKNFEIKWKKVSLSKVELYLDLIEYFFTNDSLHFRCLIVPSKKILNHKAFKQTHDDWYYKMYYEMLKFVFTGNNEFNVYLDIKDTHGGEKIEKLHSFLGKTVVRKIQIVRSHEIQLLQLTDLLIGAISYFTRELAGNKGKEKIIEKIKNSINYPLNKTSPYCEEKFNLFYWKAQET